MSLVDMVESQVIASVHNENDLKYAVSCKANIVFLLTGDLMTTPRYIQELQDANKLVFLHLDFIEGISNSKSALAYVASKWKPTGVITTKSYIVKMANDLGLETVQRIFLLDRGAINKGIEMVKSCKPSAVEIMPGIIPKVIDELSRNLNFPIIAGGLITNLTEVHEALEAGALAVSSGDPEMWNYDL